MGLICGPYDGFSSNDKNISIDDWLCFYWNSDLKFDLLKNAITDIVLKKVKYPDRRLTAVEEAVLTSAKQIISYSENLQGLKACPFVGEPPLGNFARNGMNSMNRGHPRKYVWSTAWIQVFLICGFQELLPELLPTVDTGQPAEWTDRSIEPQEWQWQWVKHVQVYINFKKYVGFKTPEFQKLTLAWLTLYQSNHTNRFVFMQKDRSLNYKNKSCLVKVIKKSKKFMFDKQKCKRNLKI